MLGAIREISYSKSNLKRQGVNEELLYSVVAGDTNACTVLPLLARHTTIENTGWGGPVLGIISLSKEIRRVPFSGPT